MRGRDAVLATLASVVWGLGFVAVKLGLESFSPAQLTALRFLIACLPIFVVARPKMTWPLILQIGMTLFTGQFLLLFFAYQQGLPPGVASVTQQTQAFFTVLLAAVFFRDFPSLRQWVGMFIAFTGLALIGVMPGAGLKPMALGLALAGAFSWAVGNVLVKRVPEVPIFPLVVWCSLIPPLPALIVSSITDQCDLVGSILVASWLSIAAVVYLGLFTTYLAYATWGRLLQRYPTAIVAPFALLAPCTGILASAAVFGETFGLIRCAGMALILMGLGVTMLPVNWTRWSSPNVRAA
jgi:O-acetylserine/cysteine efflux transporter